METEDRNKNTPAPLHLAAKQGHEGVVQVSSNTFCHKCHQCVQTLVDSSNDLTSINLSDHNPLLEAITRGNREVILAWSTGIASGCLET